MVAVRPSLPDAVLTQLEESNLKIELSEEVAVPQITGSKRYDSPIGVCKTVAP